MRRLNPPTIPDDRWGPRMSTKRTYDREGHAHFVTFSCYQRRRLLDDDRAKRMVLGVLGSQLARQGGRCVGFVVMPDHVHAIVHFAAPEQICLFLKQWKQLSSVQIKRLLRTRLAHYAAMIGESDPVWQAGSYDFNLENEAKTEEKLVYIHQNPVRAGLVGRACDWPWSSARYYEKGLSVGVRVGWLD